MVEILYQIYLITNTINGKRYIGQVIQSRGYQKRFEEHLRNKKITRLTSAIKHCGRDAFTITLIEDNIPEKDIDGKEKYYIKKYNSYYLDKEGYNMTRGGQGTHGYEFTEEINSKQSEHSKKMWEDWRQNPEKLKRRNAKLSQSLKGKPKTERCRKLISEKAKERYKSRPGTMLGKKHSEEALIKMRAAANNRKLAVGMYDKNSGELVKEFDSLQAATEYLIEKGLTANKGASTRIKIVCDKIPGQGKVAYGYKWKYLNK